MVNSTKKQPSTKVRSNSTTHVIILTIISLLLTSFMMASATVTATATTATTTANATTLAGNKPPPVCRKGDKLCGDNGSSGGGGIVINPPAPKPKPPGKGSGGTGKPNHNEVIRNTTMSFERPSGNLAENIWGQQARSQCNAGPNSKSAGARITHKYKVNDDGVEVAGSRQLVSVACINYNIRTVNYTCAVESKAVIEQKIPITKARVIASKTQSSGFLSSNRSPDACNNARTDVYLGASPTDYGRYEARATTWSVPVRYERKHDPILNRVTYKVLSIGSKRAGNPHVMRLQIDCARETLYWHGSNHNWTHTDCGPDSGSARPIYQCVRDNNEPRVAINGNSQTSATVFRDGQPNKVTWDVVRPSSAMKVSSVSTRWTRDAKSTPWRENGLKISEANVKLSRTTTGNQLFNTDTATNWVSGAQGTAYVSGYWASEEGKPTRIRPTWRYNGTISVRTIQITGFDGTRWNHKTVSRNIHSQAVCHGPYVGMTFVRAVQGNNG